ncbi:carbon monoxide dehydrogenase operon G protein [Sagittula stellata E-37]|uniref:Carbon monoxide dehydrogenase operon G protein n=2 Tax=Sagittula stellata TaxID=52603 RepID=A3K6B0_SAGS3|nr:carbon monoxide dehydrogenase operon G protein [Sagittula stellata E-37]
MSDSRTIKAPREVVWEAILNPEVLKACVPGCTEMSGSAEEGFEATVVQKVGPVKATFKGKVNLENMDAPNTVKLVGEGKGGAAGFAKGSAVVKLEDAEDGTLLTYDVDASVGGKLAQLGSRIIDGFAKKMADQFFSNFQEAVEGPSDPEEAPETEADDGKKKGWFKRMVSN